GRNTLEFGCRGLGEDLANVVPGLDVSGRVRAAGAPDRRLIDELHVVDQVGALEGVDAADLQASNTPNVALIPVEETVANQRRLSGARDAADGDEHSERDGDVDSLEIVL